LCVCVNKTHIQRLYGHSLSEGSIASCSLDLEAQLVQNFYVIRCPSWCQFKTTFAGILSFLHPLSDFWGTGWLSIYTGSL